jgi:hypothetical protein
LAGVLVARSHAGGRSGNDARRTASTTMHLAQILIHVLIGSCYGTYLVTHSAAVYGALALLYLLLAGLEAAKLYWEGVKRRRGVGEAR